MEFLSLLLCLLMLTYVAALRDDLADAQLSLRHIEKERSELLTKEREAFESFAGKSQALLEEATFALHARRTTSETSTSISDLVTKLLRESKVERPEGLSSGTYLEFQSDPEGKGNPFRIDQRLAIDLLDLFIGGQNELQKDRFRVIPIHQDGGTVNILLDQYLGQTWRYDSKSGFVDIPVQNIERHRLVINQRGQLIREIVNRTAGYRITVPIANEKP